MITNQDILLATEVDKTNQPITIYYCSDVSKSLSFSLMFEVYAQMLEQNLVFQAFEWKDLKNYHVIFATDRHHKVLSGLTFRISKQRVSILTFAFSISESRNRGISKICFKYYLQKSIELNAIRTYSVVSKHNQNVVKEQEDKKFSYSGPEAERSIYLLKF